MRRWTLSGYYVSIPFRLRATWTEKGEIIWKKYKLDMDRKIRWLLKGVACNLSFRSFTFWNVYAIGDMRDMSIKE